MQATLDAELFLIQQLGNRGQLIAEGAACKYLEKEDNVNAQMKYLSMANCAAGTFAPGSVRRHSQLL
jgi:hypothetical protein|eukprot:COSAG01_NODE_4136_length_5308_cov_65.001728_3_plen_67_part_00